MKKILFILLFILFNTIGFSQVITKRPLVLADSTIGGYSIGAGNLDGDMLYWDSTAASWLSTDNLIWDETNGKLTLTTKGSGGSQNAFVIINALDSTLFKISDDGTAIEIGRGNVAGDGTDYIMMGVDNDIDGSGFSNFYLFGDNITNRGSNNVAHGRFFALDGSFITAFGYNHSVDSSYSGILGTNLITTGTHCFMMGAATTNRMKNSRDTSIAFGVSSGAANRRTPMFTLFGDSAKAGNLATLGTQYALKDSTWYVLGGGYYTGGFNIGLGLLVSDTGVFGDGIRTNGNLLVKGVSTLRDILTGNDTIITLKGFRSNGSLLVKGDASFRSVGNSKFVFQNASGVIEGRDSVPLYIGVGNLVAGTRVGSPGNGLVYFTDTTHWTGNSKEIEITLSIADDATYTLPTSTTGRMWITVADIEEWAEGIHWTTAGTVTLGTNSADVVTTDTDAKFCIITGADPVIIKNRLGGVRTVTIHYNYR